jgi:hypothetical protein
MTIRDDYDLDKTVGDFGIEIEVEGSKLPREVNQYWKAIEDPSLRGESREYVFAKPQDLDKIKPILGTLKKAFEAHGSTLKFSFRTSVHVHVNVQEMEAESLLSLIYTYLLLEEPLMNLCGESRKGNRFCLRMQDADGLVDALKQVFTLHRGGFGRINKDQIRYAAINTEAVVKYGSLEFRAMEGNFDIPRLVNWCTLLKCLRTFALEYNTPIEVYNLYNEIGPVDFAKKVFGEHYKLVEYDNLTKDVQRGYSLSLDLPFLFKKSEKKKALNKLNKLDIKIMDGIGEIGRMDVQLFGRAFPGHLIREQGVA